MITYLFILFFLISLESDSSFGCALYHEGTFYELKKLASPSFYKVDLENNLTFEFNICDNLVGKCGSNTNKLSYGRIISNQNSSNCTDVAYGYDQHSFSVKKNFITSSYVELNYNNYTAICPYNNINDSYSYILNLNCNDSIKNDPNISATLFKCSILVNFTHAKACPMLEVGILWDFFNKHSAILFFILLPSGILSSLFGLKLFNPTLFVLGFLTGSFAFNILFYEFIMSASSPQFVIYIVVGISIVVGIVFGYLLFLNSRYGIFLLGSLLGYFIMMILWSLFVHSIFNESISALYILTTLFIIGGAFLTYLLHNHLILISTSYVGSYLVFKGIGILFGGFPSEYTLYEQIKNGAVQKFGISVYVYILLILVYGTFCLVYQEKKYFNDLKAKFNKIMMKENNDLINKEEQNIELLKK